MSKPSNVPPTSSSSSKSVVFLDRDGVLNVDYGYTYKIEDLKLAPGVIQGLKLLSAAGFEFVVLTNQSGVARGLFSLGEVHKFHEALTAQIQNSLPDLTFLDFMICPHHPKGSVSEFSFDCSCRKPKTELVDQAVQRFQINRDASWLIGDKASDIECAENAGLKGIQIIGGAQNYERHPSPFATASDLEEAARIILQNS